MRPVLPAYDGGCLSNLVPALLGERSDDWLPEAARGAAQVVLVLLDGLGWEQLEERRHLAPNLSALTGGPITSVAPTTTAAALTSVTTGSAPAEHGVLGYRVRVGEGEVLNVLRWTTAAGDARGTVDAASFVRRRPFGGRPVPVVTRAEFASTGFTAAHLAGTRLVGWRVPSNIPVDVAGLVAGGERLVYAYYDGIDKVAHDHGFGSHYDAELRAADAMVGELRRALPAGAVLVVTADHGQVEVGDRSVTLDDDVLADVSMLSGEGRFRWLHAKPGRAEPLLARARERYGDIAWVRSLAEVEAEGWFGGPLPPDVALRVGDVALVPFGLRAFADPADTGDLRLVCRHGSLTSAEMLVPLLVGGG